MNKRFLKMIISVFIFLGIVAFHMYGVYNAGSEDEEVLAESTLPVVAVLFEDMRINNLCGYTMDMEVEYMRDNITPINDDNSLEIIIDRYENSIVNISYEIRSIDGTRLIEEKTLDYFEVKNDNVLVELELSNILEYDTEYMLNVILVTESHEKVNYYTRIIKESKSTVGAYIKYVKDFSSSTFDKEEFGEYKASLERYGVNDDTNYGIVNNGSDNDSITWGNLKPKYASQPVVQVKEILGDISCIELKYMVEITNEYGNVQYYNVTEYFRVRQGNTMMYVYVYERKMEQLFECNNANVTDSRINVGIDSDLDIEFSESPTGSFISFVKERNLWFLDVNENVMVNIFSMDSGITDDVRNKFDNSDIEIVSTNKDGDVLFLVYGYMNRGVHEGKIGVALYQYTHESKSVEELVFVPSKNSYYILKENIGKFAYITSDDLLYLMIEDSIYTITFDSNEYVLLVSGLREGNFIISDDNTMVAWHENGSLYESSTIRVIDIENSEDYVIKAPEGEYVKVCGFVQHDLVYGTARISDIEKYATEDYKFPMYKLNVKVAGSDNEEEYLKEGYYINSISIKDNVINLDRVVRNEEGVLVGASEDQFVNKIAGETQLSEISYIATDLKRKELVIIKAFAPESGNTLTIGEVSDIVYTNANALTVEKGDDYVDNKYYLYANGGLYLSTEDISLAVTKAQEKYGVVVDGKGEYVFARMSKTNGTSITGVKEILEKGYANLSEVAADENINVLDISGASSETIFYFTSKNMPVVTKLPDEGLVVISAHSGYATLINEVEFTHLWTREVFYMDYDEALEKLDINKRYIVIEK
ncbi:MAG: hypothetical protein J6L69_04055 [Lachnospiraceae bacterium]|nr:hypothetical protein [Lachnospiraceae bacterium]